MSGFLKVHSVRIMLAFFLVVSGIVFCGYVAPEKAHAVPSDGSIRNAGSVLTGESGLTSIEGMTVSFDGAGEEFNEPDDKGNLWWCWYDGRDHEPPIEITETASYGDGDYYEYTLQKDFDYIIRCSDNVNAGKAKVLIEGIGDYTGSIAVYFEIRKAELVEEDESAGGDYYYDAGKVVA